MAARVVSFPSEPAEATPRRPVSQKERLALFLAQKGRCAKCGGKFAMVDMQVDHVLPLGLEGKHEPDNWEFLCLDCHKGKTATDIRRMRKADRAKRLDAGLKPKSGLRSAGFRKDPLHWSRDT